MDPVSLTTGRLLLRPHEPRDEPEVLDACSDPDVARWTTVPSPYTAQDARTWVREVVPRGWADGTTASFLALHATTGRVAGSVSLMGIADGSAEVGYWTAPSARGQGLTAEAVAAVCRWGFGGLGLTRVLWQAEVGNVGSRAVAESTGFTVEGTLRQALPGREGGRVDAWVGTLLAGDEQRDRRRFGSFRPLSGEGLVLRHWRADDVPAVVAALSEAESQRWLPVPAPYTEQDARAFVRDAALRWAEGRGAALAVEQDGVAVGLVVVLPNGLDPGLAELGWWVAPTARGHRVTARALRVLLPWARERGFRRLEAHVDVDNVVSQRTCEGAGLLREGVLRAGMRPIRGGPRRDGVLYAVVLDPPD